MARGRKKVTWPDLVMTVSEVGASYEREGASKERGGGSDERRANPRQDGVIIQ